MEAASAQRTIRIGEPLPRTLVALTFVTGMIDAISFLALGLVFAAMMTGNVLFLGFGIAGSERTSVVGPLVAIAGFLAGGLLGGVIADRSPERPGRGLLACLALEVALLAVATVIALAAKVQRDESVAWVIIAILAVAMGARVTAVRRIGVKELQTTVLQVTAASFQAGSTFAAAAPSHLVPRAAAVIAMFAGAIAGALLVDEVSLPAALGAATGLSLVAAVAYAFAAAPADARAD
jgi:uncharacterized membrane protein YoaK (UPF0700 family)